MEDKKLKEVYNKAAKDFLHSRTTKNHRSGFWNREVERPLIFKLVPKNLSDLSLLDVGCGPGIHIKEYEKRGANCFGIDFSEQMIQLAKKGCPNSNFNIGNVNNLEFEDNSFDIVTASLVLDHLKDLSKGIDEISRVLKKGGLFIFSAPHPIGNLLGDPDKSDNVLSRSYFDKKEFYINIAGTGKIFVDYPRTIGDHINTLISKGFELIEFVENEPKEEWKKRYEDLNEFYFKMPFICLFKWKKK